ncbi:MAG: lamin tail domain-containing protein [Dehalococcoidia bacterium]
MRRLAFVGAMAAALLGIAVVMGEPRSGSAQAVDLLPGVIDGTFEGDGAGWLASSAGQSSLDASGPVHSGTHAMRVEGTRPGAAGIRTQPWLLPTAAGAAHTARVWVYDDDPGTSSIEVELAFFGADGISKRNTFIATVGSATAGWQLVTVTLIGGPGTSYVGIEVRAVVTEAGPRFYVDDVTLERDPLPQATPTATASGTATATSTVTPAPSATPAATSTPTSTVSPTSTAAATPVPPEAPRVFDVLTNGDFSSGLYGWSDVGADVEAAGGAAQMTSASTSTKYLYQTVRVTPGGWYEGGAYLALGAGVDAAWVRIGWYASDDGSGSQLATVDAAGVSSGAGAVRTGAVQAPYEAHTAQVRVMLRPLGGSQAELTVDDVWFGPASAPPPAPAATATTAAPAATGPTPASGATGPSGGAAAPAGDPGEAPAAVREGGVVTGSHADGSAGGTTGGTSRASSGAAATASGAGSASHGAPTSGASGAAGPEETGVPPLAAPAAEILLRITELMPDPVEPGNDADFEWVEVSNVGGGQPVSLGGMVLRDNTGAVALPEVTLQPGAALVLAGPRAVVPQASAFWPASGLSNGLGNSGDRLALLAADGRVIDALSYGSDATYDSPPLPAPGTGRSLKRHFGDDGSFAGYEVSDEPSPGRTEPPPARLVESEASSDGGSAAAEGRESDRSTWYVLGGLGAVALAGAAGQRLWALRRGGGGAAADGV